MAEMLDPGLEHLHRHGRAWRWTTARQRISREAILDGLLLLPIAVLFLVSEHGQWGSPLQVALLVAACAAAALVRFDIGSGSASPLVLFEVPLWFAVPPQWLPVFVGLGLALSRVIERYKDHEQAPMWRTLMGAGDAWHAVGPAAVLTIYGAPTASAAGFGIFALAFVAQAAVDMAVSILAPWFMHGVRPSVSWRLTAWIVGVDCALAPIGFLAALVITDQPFALLALIPLVLVLGEFASERRSRLDQAVQLSSAYRGTAQLMGDVLEADDAYTGGEHTRGVVDTAVAVGLEMRLTSREMRDLEFGALLHDIGKLRVPNEIINKPGALSEREWALMRQHPIHGQQMLDRVGGALAEAGRIVRAHHERWDGNGYPDGLAGRDIPVAARIITVCDSFSAMTTDRAYRRGRTTAEAFEELERCGGTQFDPDAVAALKRVMIQEAIAHDEHDDPRELSPVARALGLRPIG